MKDKYDRYELEMIQIELLKLILKELKQVNVKLIDDSSTIDLPRIEHF